MSILEINKSLQEISAAKQAEVRAFLDELEAEDWDNQTAQDQAEGGLNALFADVKADIQAGKIEPL